MNYVVDELKKTLDSHREERPHKYPFNNHDDDILAWKCAACGAWIEEFGLKNTSKCLVDWRAPYQEERILEYIHSLQEQIGTLMMDSFVLKNKADLNAAVVQVLAKDLVRITEQADYMICIVDDYCNPDEHAAVYDASQQLAQTMTGDYATRYPYIDQLAGISNENS